jgi:coniferyl-aldehyde dehydrogenase
VDAGYEVVDLEDDAEVDRSTRQMPISLIVDPGDELGVMQEEIFGPCSRSSPTTRSTTRSPS